MARISNLHSNESRSLVRYMVSSTASGYSRWALWLGGAGNNVWWLYCFYIIVSRRAWPHHFFSFWFEGCATPRHKVWMTGELFPNEFTLFWPASVRSSRQEKVGLCRHQKQRREKIFRTASITSEIDHKKAWWLSTLQPGLLLVVNVTMDSVIFEEPVLLSNVSLRL